MKMAKEKDSKQAENSETSPKSKLSQNSSGRIKAKIYRGKETREFNERMGLSNSALVISKRVRSKNQDNDQ